MFKFVSSLRYRQLVTAYADKKGIKYKSAKSKDGEAMLYFENRFYVQIQKFCIKNKIKGTFVDNNEAIYMLIYVKDEENLDNFTYLYKHGIISDDKLSGYVDVACAELDHEIVGYLLDLAPNEYDYDTLIGNVCEREDDNADIVRILLDKCVVSEDKLPNLAQYMEIAVDNGNYQIVELLIKSGFNPADESGFANVAFAECHRDICELLLDNGDALDISGGQEADAVVDCISSSRPLAGHGAVDKFYSNIRDGLIKPGMIEFVCESYMNLDQEDILLEILGKGLVIAAKTNSLEMVQSIIYESGLDFGHYIKKIIRDDTVTKSIRDLLKSQ